MTRQNCPSCFIYVGDQTNPESIAIIVNDASGIVSCTNCATREHMAEDILRMRRSINGNAVAAIKEAAHVVARSEPFCNWPCAFCGGALTSDNSTLFSRMVRLCTACHKVLVGDASKAPSS